MMVNSFNTSILVASLCLSAGSAFSPGNSDVPFSLSAYQKARAQETSAQLDASRFHFQILFVDNDNFRGRIAECMLARIAEYNDALFTLFPYSATIESSPNAPVDSTAPQDAMAVCDALGLCPATCAEDGTSFNLSYDLDQYDLIIALDDEIQSLILRSLPPPSPKEDAKGNNNDGGSYCGYEQKCRTLSEFLSIDFCGIQSKGGNLTDQSLQDMIEPELWDRAMPFYDFLAKESSGSSSSNIIFDTKTTNVYDPRMILSNSGAAVPNSSGWPLVEASYIVACAGITRFCLDTMDAQFDVAFTTLLERHFYHPNQILEISVEEADDQLRLGSLSVTGYFSPKERYARIEQHFEELRSKFL